MYCVIDWYEGGEILGYNIINKKDAQKLVKKQIKDTDGECDVEIFEQDREYKREEELEIEMNLIYD